MGRALASKSGENVKGYYRNTRPVTELRQECFKPPNKSA